MANELVASFEGGVILIGGASGVGKTAIVDTLIKNRKELYCRPVSYTSREKRADESDNEYLFVSRKEIYEMKERGELLSIDEVYGNLYATSLKSIKNILQQKKYQ